MLFTLVELALVPSEVEEEMRIDRLAGPDGVVRWKCFGH